MEQLPKIVRERLEARTKLEVHPDPNLLTAFAENSLAERERLPILEHLSSCADCREVVLLAQPELAMQQVAAAAAMAASPVPARNRRSSRLIFSWGAVAACVVIGVVLLGYQTHERKLAEFASRQAAPTARADETSNMAQPAAPPPENQLADKLEPPSPLESKSDIRMEKPSARTASARVPSPLVSKKFGAAGAIGGQIGGAVPTQPSQPIPQVSEQVAVSGEATAVAAAPALQQEIPLESRSATAKETTTKEEKEASKDLMATAAPPPAQNENKASAPPSANAAAPRRDTALDSLSSFSAQKSKVQAAQGVANQKLALARVSSNLIPARWSISSDGSTLLRSTDQGKSWDTVNVASNVVFRAVAALGPEIWAGGKAGALYHSSDQGMHWTQVKPEANSIALTTDIVTLDFSDALHGKLTGSDGKVWTTSDGGKTWQTQ